MNPKPNNIIPLGSVVRNFNAIAMVVASHDDERGTMVREAGGREVRWYADPAKCEVVIDRNPVLIASWHAIEPSSYGGADAFLAGLRAIARAVAAS